MNYRKRLRTMIAAGVIAAVNVYLLYKTLLANMGQDSFCCWPNVLNVQSKIHQTQTYHKTSAFAFIQEANILGSRLTKAKIHKALETTPKITTITGSISVADVTTVKPKVRRPTSAAVVNGDFLVPPIVHYTWYSKRKLLFRFHHFISVLSAYKHIKPKKIMFWYELKPQGPWWEEINRRVPVIEMVFRKAPTEIYGKSIKIAEHQSDIVRLEALMKYGGIYTDLDVVVVKSFDPLRNYNTTMGYESSYGLCNGIIISAPNATFLNIWHKNYKSFNNTKWAFHSVLLPAQLARKHAELIHTEVRSLHRPNWNERVWLYNTSKIFDWSKNYAVHLWFRYHNIDHNPDDIRTMDTTMGQLFRYIYYDKKDLYRNKLL